MLSIGLMAEAAPPARALPALDARLEYRGGQWPVQGAVVRIGSADTAEFRLPGVSQVHAEITRHGRKIYIRDAGSRSGTRVNGQLITVPHPLVDGDQVQIEDHLIVFRSAELVREAVKSVHRANVLGLEVLNGKSRGLTFGLSQSPVLVGSGPTCQLQLSEPSVAREHARISPYQGQYAISDLGTPGGTRINGSPLSPHQNVLLAENTVFSVGVVEIRYGLGAVAGTVLFETAAKLSVDRGPNQGRTFRVTGRCTVGSAPDCDLVIEGLFPRHLELQREAFDFFVRDVTGQSRSFRSGTPLGSQFSPLNSGDLLLLGADIMLRFEEEL